MGCLILREVSSDPLLPCNRDPDCMQFVEYCNSALVEPPPPPPLVSANSPPNRDYAQTFLSDFIEKVEKEEERPSRPAPSFGSTRFIGPQAFGPTSHQTMIIEYVLGLQQTASRHQNRCQLRQEIILGGAFIASVIIWTLLCCLCRCICCCRLPKCGTGNRSAMIGSAPAGRNEVVMVKV